MRGEPAAYPQLYPERWAHFKSLPAFGHGPCCVGNPFGD